MRIGRERIIALLLFLFFFKRCIDICLRCKMEDQVVCTTWRDLCIFYYFSLRLFPIFTLSSSIFFLIHCLFSTMTLRRRLSLNHPLRTDLLLPVTRLCPTGKKKFMLIFEASPKGSLCLRITLNFSSLLLLLEKKTVFKIHRNKNLIKVEIRRLSKYKVIVSLYFPLSLATAACQHRTLGVIGNVSTTRINRQIVPFLSIESRTLTHASQEQWLLVQQTDTSSFTRYSIRHIPLMTPWADRVWSVSRGDTFHSSDSHVIPYELQLH